ADSQGGIQKVHEGLTPRIGGLAIFPACVAGAFFVDGLALGSGEELLGLFGSSTAEFSMLALLICGLPILLAGLVEDVTKQVSVSIRFWASCLSGLLGAVFLGAALPRLGLGSLDGLFQYAWVAIPFTAFAVAGVVNSINIIDGFNGLASGVVTLLGLGLAFVAEAHGDYTMMYSALVISMASVGFALVNYFTGRLFLGDGGAYFLGFMLAEIAVLLVARNPALSPWVILALFAYPVTEVVTSMVRRKLVKRETGQPDRDHLHHLIQNLLLNTSKTGVTQVNTSVSKWLWLFTWVAVVGASQVSTLPESIYTYALVAVLVGLYLLIYVKCKHFTRNAA
ncbi:MAG: MraY family glycosyltransferase, partial [Limnobacter sp.]|nr:MraY family glycosyltransferase [Limnobacter sp.]